MPSIAVPTLLFLNTRLVGSYFGTGHKTDCERFYGGYVPRTDGIYDDYLREVRQGRQRDNPGGDPGRWSSPIPQHARVPLGTGLPIDPGGTSKPAEV